MNNSAEHKRLAEAREEAIPWKQWGPYLSERQWGTVREDYSENGDAWNFFTHDQARSRAYRWGEDGLAGISDDKQRLCFALALWNGKDPILKERLFGLTNSEGNHGEDVKEYYFYLDSTPTHSYMKYLYKYPQAAYPYADLVETNQRRSRDEMEYELLDTGVFRRGPLLRCLRGVRQGSRRRTSWSGSRCTTAGRKRPRSTFCRPCGSATTGRRGSPRHPQSRCSSGSTGRQAPVRSRRRTRSWGRTACTAKAMRRCCLPRTRPTTPDLGLDYPDGDHYFKDGINNYVVQGDRGAVNPEQVGTKAAAHYRLKIGPGQSATVRLRLTAQSPAAGGEPAPLRAGL